jgi:hypothetical protein
MKKLLILLSCVSFQAFSQSSLDVTEEKPSVQNGIEYSYIVKNERNEDTYSRYEVVVMAQNKSGCPLIYFKKSAEELNSLFDGDPAALARFECINATGKRLTSKGANVKAKSFFVPYSRQEKTADGKTKTVNENVEGGYLLKNGSSVSNTLTVIVPKGEKPKFKVRLQNFAEMAGE